MADFDSNCGDNNFDRNLQARKDPAPGDHAIVKSLRFLDQAFDSVLEVGCSTGFVLETIRLDGISDAWGVDISERAVMFARQRFPHCHFATGDILNLPEEIAARKFDCVILGFYLFVVDPRKWLLHVDAAMSLLADGGHLLIYDFSSPFTNLSRDYVHEPGLFSWKGNFHRSLEVLPGLVKVFEWQKQVGSVPVPEFETVSIYRVYSIEQAFLHDRRDTRD